MKKRKAAFRRPLSSEFEVALVAGSALPFVAAQNIINFRCPVLPRHYQLAAILAIDFVAACIAIDRLVQLLIMISACFICAVKFIAYAVKAFIMIMTRPRFAINQDSMGAFMFDSGKNVFLSSVFQQQIRDFHFAYTEKIRFDTAKSFCHPLVNVDRERAGATGLAQDFVNSIDNVAGGGDSGSHGLIPLFQPCAYIIAQKNVLVK